MNEMFSIKGKVIAVTGAAGVLAGATARYLARQGAKVAFLDRDIEKLLEVKKECDAENLETMHLKVDVLDKDILISVREEILANWGTIDCIVNGAGGNMAGAVIQPDQRFFDLDLNAWDKVLALNCKGTLLPTLVLGEVFEKTKSGCVVNFSSMSAQQAITRVLGYSNAKAAIDNLTKWLCVEFGKKLGEKVRVNAIAPGFFLTEQNRTLLTNPDGSLTDRGNTILRETPFEKFGEPSDVFGAIHYLCSDASKFVSGSIIPIDGGFSAFSGV